MSPKTNLKIAFSPQHGASYELGPQILKKAGFNFIKAPKQSLLDSNFTHTLDPNPENPLAFNELIEVGKKNQVDLLLTTDPDGDRIALGVLHNHDYRLINGHEMATIIVWHLLFKKSNANLLTAQSSIIKSIVTTSLVDQICQHYNVQVIKTLTGFKYLGEAMKNTFPKPFIGIEESYGAALFPHLSLDKDSLQLLPFVADMTSYYKARGKTLVDVLESLYKKYGYYVSVNENIALKSNDIPKEWATIYNHFRKVAAIGPLQVKQIEDFEKGISKFDKTQLLFITFSDDSWIALRPSGTETLIRIYFCIRDPNKANAKAKFWAIKNYLTHL